MAALVTTSEYKTYAGITGSGEDTLLGVLIDAASAAARRACDRNETNGFESTERTETYDGKDSANIQLNEWPVSLVTSVTIVGDDGSTTVLSSSDYRIKPASGVLYMLGAARGRFAVYSPYYQTYVAEGFGERPNFPRGIENVSVVYTGGWATIPADLKMAIYRIVDILYAERRKDPGIQSESLGQYSYTRAANVVSMDEQVRAMLSRFQTLNP